jgi:hypothetical protein
MANGLEFPQNLAELREFQAFVRFGRPALSALF